MKKLLSAKKKLQKEMEVLAKLCLDDWEMIIKVKRTNFLSHAVKDWCWRMHNHDWLNVSMSMTHSEETLLSAKAMQITLTSRQDDVEKMEIVVRSFWSLKHALKLIEHTAATLHSVVEASYTISRSISSKSAPMKSLVSTSCSKIKQLMESLKPRSSDENKIWCNSEYRSALKNTKHREAEATPDRRLVAVTEVVDILGERVKHLVLSTSVKAMRLGEVKRFEDEFPQLSYVREMASGHASLSDQ